MSKELDLMTGEPCDFFDQLPAKASNESIKKLALVAAFGALALGVIGIGVPSPRTLPNVILGQK